MNNVEVAVDDFNPDVPVLDIGPNPSLRHLVKNKAYKGNNAKPDPFGIHDATPAMAAQVPRTGRVRTTTTSQTAAG